VSKTSPAQITSERKKGTIISSPTSAAFSPEESVNVALLKAAEKMNPEETVVRPLNVYMSRIPTKIVADHDDFIPKYKSKGAACCDLVANIPPDETGKQVVTITPNTTVRIDCGFSMQLPVGYEAQVRARGSMASRGLVVTNAPGTIDDDYRGRIMVLLTNVGREVINIRHKERFAQIALKPVWYFVWDSVDSLDTSERQDGAFGSTGEI